MLTGSYRWNPDCHTRTVRLGQYRGKASSGSVASVLSCRIHGRRWKYPFPTRSAEGVSLRVLHPSESLILPGDNCSSWLGVDPGDGGRRLPERSPLPRIRPRVGPAEFLQLAREVDAFATLNYSKRKRITAADVEQYLRSKGSCAPVTTSSLAQRGDGVIDGIINSIPDAMTRRPLETG